MLRLISICCLIFHLIFSVGAKSLHDDCAFQCLVRLNRKLKDNYGSLTAFQEPWTVGDLESQCTHVKLGLSCFDSCLDTGTKDMLSPLTYNLRNVCLHRYKEFVEHRVCLNMEWHTIKYACTKKCGEYTELGSVISDVAIGIKRLTPKRLYLGLDSYCSRFKCNLYCQFPHFLDKCDHDAAVLAASCDQKTLKALQVMISHKRLLTSWPLSCNDLANCWIFRYIDT